MIENKILLTGVVVFTAVYALAQPSDILSGPAQTVSTQIINNPNLKASDMIKALGNFDPNTQFEDGNTLLHLVALNSKNPLLVKTLVAKGANVNALNFNKDTPLHMVRNAAVAKALIVSGADVAAEDNFGTTALENVESVEVLKVLISAGADARHVNQIGENALYGKASAQMIKLLIAAGANIRQKNVLGKTCLYYAASAKALKTMIEAGADVDSRATNGRTALDYYIFYGDESASDMILVLLDAGASIRGRYWWSKNAYQRILQNPRLKNSSARHKIEQLVKK